MELSGGYVRRYGAERHRQRARAGAGTGVRARLGPSTLLGLCRGGRVRHCVWVACRPRDVGKAPPATPPRGRFTARRVRAHVHCRPTGPCSLHRDRFGGCACICAHLCDVIDQLDCWWALFKELCGAGPLHCMSCAPWSGSWQLASAGYLRTCAPATRTGGQHAVSALVSHRCHIGAWPHAVPVRQTWAGVITPPPSSSLLWAGAYMKGWCVCRCGTIAEGRWARMWAASSLWWHASCVWGRWHQQGIVPFAWRVGYRTTNASVPGFNPCCQQGSTCNTDMENRRQSKSTPCALSFMCECDM